MVIHSLCDLVTLLLRFFPAPCLQTESNQKLELEKTPLQLVGFSRFHNKSLLCDDTPPPSFLPSPSPPSPPFPLPSLSSLPPSPLPSISSLPPSPPSPPFVFTQVRQTPLSRGVWLSRAYSPFLVGVALAMRLLEISCGVHGCRGSLVPRL